jgi:hypothetical protein
MRQASRVSRSPLGGVLTFFRRPGARSDLVRKAMRARQPGQAAVESALTAAIAIMTILTVLQLSLVAAQSFSAAHVARSTARWLAVRMDTTDAQVLAQAQTVAADLPGMAGGGLNAVLVSPSCASLTGSPGICSGRDTGTAVTVTVRTSVAAVLFLPSSFGVAPFTFTLPGSAQTLNFAYTVLLE